MVRTEDHGGAAQPVRSLGHGEVGRGRRWTWGERGAARRSHQREQAAQQVKLNRLALLGIHPDSLAGRLRLVLTIGCYSDFRFTRDILSSSAKHEQIERAVETLIDLGARCDCEVFRALGQMPRSLLWHHPTAHEVR